MVRLVFHLLSLYTVFVSPQMDETTYNGNVDCSYADEDDDDQQISLECRGTATGSRYAGNDPANGARNGAPLNAVSGTGASVPQVPRRQPGVILKHAPVSIQRSRKQTDVNLSVDGSPLLHTSNNDRLHFDILSIY